MELLKTVIICTNNLYNFSHITSFSLKNHQQTQVSIHLHVYKNLLFGHSNSGYTTLKCRRDPLHTAERSVPHFNFYRCSVSLFKKKIPLFK